MFCKFAVTSAMVSIFAVGAWMHAPVHHSGNDAVVHLNTTQEEGDSEVELNDESDPPSTHSAMHDHFMEVHDGVLDHLHGLFGLGLATPQVEVIHDAGVEPVAETTSMLDHLLNAFARPTTEVVHDGFSSD